MRKRKRKVVKSKQHPHLGGNIKGGDIYTDFPSLYSYLTQTYSIKTVLDLGCGEGHTLKRFSDLGCYVLGIEGLAKNVEKCKHPTICHDITKGSFRIKGIDLVWCCEVVEHIEEKYLDYLLDFLCCGRVIAMTAARPNQGGYHHVNCQPPEYWIQLIEGKGYRNVKIPLNNVGGFWEKNGLCFIKSTE